MRKLIIVLGVVLLLGAVGLVLMVRWANPAPPAVPSSWTAPTRLPQGPPLAKDRLAFDSDRTGNFEVFTLPHDGGDAEQLTDDADWDSWSPRLSPDRRTILVHRAPAGVHDKDHTKVSLWAMASDGSGLTELRPPGLDGWVQQGHAEWSPDGGRLTMFGGSKINPQVWITDAFGQNPKAVTDRPGANLDPAFTPDGTHVLFVGCPGAICTPSKYEVYRVSLDGSDEQRLTDDDLRDHDPYLSPDGSTLAWLTSFGGSGLGVWDIQLADPDGRDARRLVDDDEVTSRPEFSADGQTIFTHRWTQGDSGFQVYRISLDGTATNLTEGQPGSNEYPSP